MRFNFKIWLALVLTTFVITLIGMSQSTTVNSVMAWAIGGTLIEVVLQGWISLRE